MKVKNNMNGELLIEKLAKRIGELEVQNAILQLQLEELMKKTEESEKA